MTKRFVALIFLATSAFAGSAFGQGVIYENVPGVANLSRLGTVVTCAGAVEATAVPEIAKKGFASIVNVREAGEPGANIAAEEAAAKAAGLRFYHIPFSVAAPDPAAVDKFLAVIKSEGVEPAFIHCRSGGRAAMMWFIKRLVVDGWDEERAEKEAVALGMRNPALTEFALAYARAHRG